PEARRSPAPPGPFPGPKEPVAPETGQKEKTNTRGGHRPGRRGGDARAKADSRAKVCEPAPRVQLEQSCAGDCRVIRRCIHRREETRSPATGLPSTSLSHDDMVVTTLQ